MTTEPRRGLRGLLLATTTAALLGAGAATVFSPGPTMAEISAGTSLLGADGSYAEIVRQDRPAIVTITTKLAAQQVDMQGPGMQPGQGMNPDEFMRRFFGQGGPFQGMPGVPGMPQDGQPGPGPQGGRALGSGFIIDASGLIVTNNHVIDKATEITVTLDDGRDFPATLVGADPKTDLAVLRIDPNGEKLPVVQWGDSDKAEVGDKVIAIGNPFGVGPTVTAGIISARGRDLNNGPYDDFLQVDAAINHGNSGGAVISTDGKVIGISTAILSPDGNSVGLGFAIPSDEAKTIVASLVDKGSVERGYLGVRIQSVSPDIASALGLDRAKGALVAEVTDGTPAAAAGIERGDVIVKVAGSEIDDARALSRLIAGIAPGKPTDVTVWRDGKEQVLSVKLGLMPDDTASAATPQPGGAIQPTGQELGMSLAPLTPDLREAMGLPADASGVVVNAVDPNSVAAEKGIAAGDVVMQAQNMPVATSDDIAAAIKAAKDAGRKSVLLLVEHQGNQVFIALPVAQG